MLFLDACGFMALRAACPQPLAAQNLSDRDWRTLAHPSAVVRIEQWEELFARAQGWVAAMNGASEDGQPTAPFEAVPIGVPVFDVWLFRDKRFGTVALGDEWVDIEKRSSRLGDGSPFSKVAFVLRYGSARVLRMFEPYQDGYRVFEI